MGNNSHRRKRWSEILAPFFFFAIGAILVLNFRQSPEDKVLAPLPPPRDLKLMAFGYDEVMADSLWLRVIQDFGLCETRDLNVKQDAQNTSATQKIRCKRGWVYQMLDAITELAPRFYSAYNFGGTILTAVVDDAEGATALFDKAITRFPNDWRLLYTAAYHALYETKDQSKAAELLRRAGDNGAPGWVYALSAKIYSKEGQAALAKSILIDALEKSPNEETAERIKLRLAEIEQTLQTGSTPEPKK